jgi:hypothetical protein
MFHTFFYFGIIAVHKFMKINMVLLKIITIGRYFDGYVKFLNMLFVRRI